MSEPLDIDVIRARARWSVYNVSCVIDIPALCDEVETLRERVSDLDGKIALSINALEFSQGLMIALSDGRTDDAYDLLSRAQPLVESGIRELEAKRR